MGEKRHDSSPTVAVPATEMAREYRRVPDDDTPTAPDLRAPCARCFDTRKVAVKTSAGTRFETCPECRPSEPPPEAA